MPAAASSVVCSADQKTITVTGLLTFSGSYTTGGDPFDLTTLLGKDGAEFSSLPIFAQVMGSDGYEFGWVPGTTLSNGKIKVLSTADTQIAASAYPASITGDTGIYFEFRFKKLF